MASGIGKSCGKSAGRPADRATILKEDWGTRLRVLFGGECLLGQFGAEFLLFFSHELFIAIGIGEGVRSAGFQVRIFSFQAEVAAVGAEENIAGQGLQNVEHALVVLGDLRIGLVVDEFVAWVDIGTANDHHVVGFAALGHLRGPRGAAFCMAGSEVRDEDCTAKLHFVAIVQHAIDFGWRIKKFRTVAVLKIGLATGFDHGHVGVHDHVACAGQRLDLGAAGIVIPVRVADQQNLGVFEFESELFDTSLEQRHICFQIAVDQNVALGRRDQITRQPLAADVVQVARDVKRRERFGPVGIVLSENTARSEEDEN
jgi:hypothetical protein